MKYSSCSAALELLGEYTELAFFPMESNFLDEYLISIFFLCFLPFTGEGAPPPSSLLSLSTSARLSKMGSDSAQVRPLNEDFFLINGEFDEVEDEKVILALFVITDFKDFSLVFFFIDAEQPLKGLVLSLVILSVVVQSSEACLASSLPDLLSIDRCAFSSASLISRSKVDGTSSSMRTMTVAMSRRVRPRWMPSTRSWCATRIRNNESSGIFNCDVSFDICFSISMERMYSLILGSIGLCTCEQLNHAQSKSSIFRRVGRQYP
mmetsp:Transcript_18597/g.25687  ORF Transcript_18597/g.25687 Transcript_18597/m.25687 type:complete len:264 (-) Transcript_18597:1324-2115(-)